MKRLIKIFIILSVFTFTFSCNKAVYKKSTSLTTNTLYFNNVQVTNLNTKLSNTDFLSKVESNYKISFVDDSNTLIADFEDFLLAKQVDTYYVTVTFFFDEKLSGEKVVEISELLNRMLDQVYKSQKAFHQHPDAFFRVWSPSKDLNVIFMQDWDQHGGELLSAIVFKQKLQKTHNKRINWGRGRYFD